MGRVLEISSKPSFCVKLLSGTHGSVLNARWESVRPEFLVCGEAEPEYLEQTSISFEPIDNQAGAVIGA
jgi:hypothetical protein